MHTKDGQLDQYYEVMMILSYTIVVAELQYYYVLAMYRCECTPPHCMCHKVERPIVERREKRDIDSAPKQSLNKLSKIQK